MTDAIKENEMWNDGKLFAPGYPEKFLRRFIAEHLQVSNHHQVRHKSDCKLYVSPGGAKGKDGDKVSEQFLLEYGKLAAAMNHPAVSEHDLSIMLRDKDGCQRWDTCLPRIRSRKFIDDHRDIWYHLLLAQTEVSPFLVPQDQGALNLYRLNPKADVGILLEYKDMLTVEHLTTTPHLEQLLYPSPGAGYDLDVLKAGPEEPWLLFSPGQLVL
jgi:hypothetical protein